MKTKLTRMFVALAWLAAPLASPAANLVVTNLADSGPGTLRSAITNADNGAVITFDPSLSGATITLGNTLTINTNLTIDVSALPGGLQINGNGSVQIFNVASTITVFLNSLTITNGYSTNSGGCIYNGGTLTLTNCTLSGNSGALGGGGIGNFFLLTLNQCTLSGNSALDEGGGIYNEGALGMTNTVVGGNSGLIDADIYNYHSATLTYGGANLVQSVDNSGGTIIGPAPLTNAPDLVPLGNYGGPKQTMPPLPGSPNRK